MLGVPVLLQDCHPDLNSYKGKGSLFSQDQEATIVICIVGLGSKMASPDKIIIAQFNAQLLNSIIAKKCRCDLALIYKLFARAESVPRCSHGGFESIGTTP